MLKYDGILLTKHRAQMKYVSPAASPGPKVG